VREMSSRSQTLLIAAIVAVIVAVAALLGTVGADAKWLAALGKVIAHRGSIPAGVPFASAPTGHWPNALVLAELIFGGLERTLGDRGLMLAQLLAVAGSMTILARDARAGGAKTAGICAALLLAALGALPSLAIARVQMFSLVLFPVLCALLRAETRCASRRIWLAVPLLALWSNLHGAALLGLAVMIAYLACSRLRREPATAIAVGCASALAICLTPALANTPAYYRGLLTNLAAERGQGMWGPLSPTNPLDLLLAAMAVVLLVRFWRARPQLWEWAVVIALAVLSVQASRNGVWLVLFLVVPAARAIKPKRTWQAVAGPVMAASLAVIGFAFVRGPAPSGMSRSLMARALVLAHGSPVLAEGQIAEQVALAGGRIWVGNPIDAFSRLDQAEYLDWLAGQPNGRRALKAQVEVVLVSSGSPAQKLMARTPGFVPVGGDRRTTIYEREASIQTSTSPRSSA
jgi:hypothetical protein